MIWNNWQANFDAFLRLVIAEYHWLEQAVYQTIAWTRLPSWHSSVCIGKRWCKKPQLFYQLWRAVFDKRRAKLGKQLHAHPAPVMHEHL